ncbi:thioredoxin-related transmembrane protein 1-like [Oppia nitens]|uniref:thioredoxin-related transmembrane protein 1-like n=1 Tax=Oppia nitens TaxID=1686743 RepID=UPI0023D9CCFD|nr:thioredoxin-related transmembrane protein 1-like [Oppia nitens]
MTTTMRYLLSSTTAVVVVLSLLMVLLCTPTAEATNKGSVITLTEDSWSDMLSGEWMVEFFAPWCPACRALQKDWNSFATWSHDLSIKVGAVDVTANPGLSGRFLVTQLPTIYHVKDGVFRQYKGTRDTNAFVSYIEEKSWQKADPVSLWTAPDSILMSVVSYFFKISMALRAVHNRLVEDYGIPYWGSYIIFALVTILCGAILGLLIVCVIDLLFPTKMVDESKERLQSSSDKKDVKEDDTTDLIDDRNQEGEEEEIDGVDNDSDDTKGELRRRHKRSQESDN